MSIVQWEKVEDILDQLYEPHLGNQWHDGDCVGADTQAHSSIKVLKSLGFAIRSFGYPCNLEKFRAHNEYDETEPVRPPLSRNRHIVNSSNLLIAAPGGYEEIIKGSGTWGTIRYARLNKVPLFIVWPDGTVKVEIDPTQPRMF